MDVILVILQVSRSSTVTGSTGSSSRKTFDQGSDTSDEAVKMEEDHKALPEKTDKIVTQEEPGNPSIESNAQETIEEEMSSESESETELSSRI